MTGMAFVDPSDTTSFVDENEEGSFIRLEQGTNYYVSPDLGFIRVRFGLGWSMALHAFYNGVLMLITFSTDAF